MLSKAKQILSTKLQNPPIISCSEICGGRYENRKIWFATTKAEEIGYYAASQVFVIERQVSSQSKKDKETSCLSYAITSLEPKSHPTENAQMLLDIFRGHWAIENKVHYRRDRTYDEDRSSIRNHNAARVLSAFKNMAIFLCEINAHNPATERDRTLPELNRYCLINGINKAISWLKDKHPLK